MKYLDRLKKQTNSKNMLTPTTVNSQTEASALISKLAAMMNRGEIKLMKGSFYDTILDVEFKVKGSPDRWALRGVNDSRGSLTLSRI
jgi:hypothetical protein